MTDEQLRGIAERLAGYSHAEGAWCIDAHTLAAAASAIRQLMSEREEAFREGQRNMQLAAAGVTNDPAIFAKIYDIPILTHPPAQS